MKKLTTNEWCLVTMGIIVFMTMFCGTPGVAGM